MRGPIDYIIVGFPTIQFKGEILKELNKAVESKTIAVLDMAVIMKDAQGNVGKFEAANLKDPAIRQLVELTGANEGLISAEDVAEVGEMLDNNTAAGLLIVEQLWAKGLKQAIINAKGVLLSDGRIHPDAYEELNV